MEVFANYLNPNNQSFAVLPFLDFLNVNQGYGSQTINGETVPPNFPISNITGGLALVPLPNNPSSSLPSAYLYLIFYPEDGTNPTPYYKRISTLAKGTGNWEKLELPHFTAPAKGRVEIFVVNESSLDVWFDDLKIEFEGALIAQETHYDPWGLELAGIGKAGLNRFTFNAQSEKQKDLNGGKGYFYETDFRGYDPQLGRFHGYDLLASAFSGITPYQFGFNNPVMFNDPTGLASQTGIDPALMKLIRDAWNATPKGSTGHFVNNGDGTFSGQVYSTSISGKSETHGNLKDDNAEYDYQVNIHDVRINKPKELSEHEKTLNNPIVKAMHEGGRSFLLTSLTIAMTIEAYTDYIPSPKTFLKKGVKAILKAVVKEQVEDYVLNPRKLLPKGKRKKKSEYFERFMSTAEAEATKEKQGLVPNLAPHHNNPKWIAIKGTRKDKVGLNLNKKNTSVAYFEAESGTTDWVRRIDVGGKDGNIEPGSFAIPVNLLEEFNSKLYNVTVKKLK